jgi:hypothetical protein
LRAPVFFGLREDKNRAMLFERLRAQATAICLCACNLTKNFEQFSEDGVKSCGACRVEPRRCREVFEKRFTAARMAEDYAVISD